MNENKNAAPGAATPGNGNGMGCVGCSFSHLDFITLPGWKQARIARQLGLGKGSAMTAQELATLLHAGSVREIGREIERERSAGIPICASVSRCPGYYLPAMATELMEYRLCLQRRVAAIVRTLEAIENVHDSITGQQRIDKEENQ